VVIELEPLSRISQEIRSVEHGVCPIAALSLIVCHVGLTSRQLMRAGCTQLMRRVTLC